MSGSFPSESPVLSELNENMDRISKLPDDDICHILSFLPTKHAVATSILSSRWLDLWKLLTVIDLDDSLYLNPSKKRKTNTRLFVRFVERLLSLNHSQTILKFRLSISHRCDGKTFSKINGFVQNVISKNVVEIELRMLGNDGVDDCCLNIPHSESLKVLKVSTDCRLKLFAFPGCFPSLRVFHAQAYVDERDEWITNVFPCLPALESLHLIANIDQRSGQLNFNIVGAALTHFSFDIWLDERGDSDCMVVIDAPKLESLTLQDAFMASYLVIHKPAIGDVCIQVGQEEEILQVGPTALSRFDELLHGLVNARSICAEVPFPQNWNLPVMPYVTKLKLDMPGDNLVLLLHWLQSCPNLEVLSLYIWENSPYEFEMPDVVSLPSCLSSCLKEIDIDRSAEKGHEKMLCYLSRNAKVLDSFTVDSEVYVKDGISQMVGL